MTGDPFDDALSRLTPRQDMVALLLGRGCTNEEIHDRTGLSTRRARELASEVLHRTGLMRRKFGPKYLRWILVKNRTRG